MNALTILIPFLVIAISVALLIKVTLAFTQKQCKSKVCLVGRTAVITGGSRGECLQLIFFHREQKLFIGFLCQKMSYCPFSPNNSIELILLPVIQSPSNHFREEIKTSWLDWI